jgi:spore coat polysaccharide biosynthesis protein SpsF
MLIGCIVQARMGSTRLPGKVMMKIENNDTMIDFVINQLNFSKIINKIIVATTTLSEDDKIINLLDQKKINYFRGSDQDVLTRFYECAKFYSLDVIVRITSDCPLIDPEIIDQLITKFLENDCDFVSAGFPRTFPQGSADIEVFSFQTLEKVWLEAKKPSDCEHVCTYIYNNPEKFKIKKIPNPTDHSNFKWSVDRYNDLKFVQEIVKRIPQRPILTNYILNMLKNEPQLIDINKNFIFEEGYKKSIEKDKKLGFIDSDKSINHIFKK